jgi:hypothetical protein
MSDGSAIYEDRTTGATFADAFAMVDAYLARFAAKVGLPAARLDETGHVLLQRGSAPIGVHVLPEQGVLMVVAPIMPVPVTGREALYRRLLELSFTATSDAAFAVDPERDEVVLRALRRLSGLDFEELEDLLVTLGRVADAWDDRLRSDFGT